MRTRLTVVIVSALAALSVLPSMGCVQSAGAPAESTDTGISIPLTQVGVSGALYHLTATFEISAPDGTVQTVDGSGADASVTVNLSAGRHSVRVDDGWTLERSTDGGTTFAVVPAFLAGNNPTDVTVVPGHTVTLGLQFVVRETTGNLSINFGVVDPPRELVGTIQFTSASGDFAAYVGTSVDLVIYFTAGAQTTNYTYDGLYPYYYAYFRTYTTSVTGIELLDDVPGLLKPLAGSLGGGALSFTIRVHGNGTQDFYGDYSSAKDSAPDIGFGTSSTASFIGGAGTFPDDVPFTASGSAVQIVSGGSVVLSGQLLAITEYL